MSSGSLYFGDLAKLSLVGLSHRQGVELYQQPSSSKLGSKSIPIVGRIKHDEIVLIIGRTNKSPLVLSKSGIGYCWFEALLEKIT